MEEENYYCDDEEGVSELEPSPPISQPSGQNFQGLLKINQIYANQLTNIASNNTNKFKSKIPYNDMKVLNSLIKENFSYLTILLKYQKFQIEFDTLYNKSLEILNLLGLIGQSKINLYQKCQQLKFMELKFQSLRISGRDRDYAEADALLDDMEKLHYDPNLKNYITELDRGTLILNRALVKFCICDIDLAKEYALNALMIFDQSNNPKNKKIAKNEEENDKYLQKLTQTHEFLAELYDLQKDYKNALSSYEKCYYLYIGRYGINHPFVVPFKKKKELYEKKVANMCREKSIIEKGNELITKLKQGKIASSKGKSDTFSFIVPETEISEPLLIKIYDLPKSPMDTNYFENYLFLKNICLDKNKLFEYLGIKDNYQKQNYILYTDEALNIILEKITVTNDKSIIFTDNSLYSIYINC